MKLVFLAALTAVLAGAGYLANGYFSCRTLEDRYLNNVSDIKGMVISSSYSSDKRLRKDVDEFKALRIKAGGELLAQLREQCGATAADNALRKGSEMLLP